MNDRLSTEWDIRLDLTNGLDITAVVENARSNKELFVYLLISGIEYGKSRADRPSNKGWISETEELHVHVAMVTLTPVNRLTALGYLRPTKTGGEYAVPRKQEHTYIGWRMHHNKVATKIGSTNPVWEYGTLPMDAFNGDVGTKVYYMTRMYGTDEDKIKYKAYIDLGHIKINEQRAERKRKANEEVEELRKRIKQLEDNQ